MSKPLARRKDRQLEFGRSGAVGFGGADEAQPCAALSGAGTPQAKGPNRSATVIAIGFVARTDGLVLCDRHPLQVHASELWTLLDLLGLLRSWTSRRFFVRFFRSVAKVPLNN